MASKRPLEAPPFGSAPGYWNPSPLSCPSCRAPIVAFRRQNDDPVSFVRCTACTWLVDLRPKRTPVPYRRCFDAIVRAFLMDHHERHGIKLIAENDPNLIR